MSAPLHPGLARLRAAGKVTVGLMTPAPTAPGVMADPTAWRHTAALAEDLGFAGLWARDVPLAIAQGAAGQVAELDDPFTWLTWLAAATRHITVGTAAVVLPLRHHIHLANSALSLDRLSSGRFVLGLGTGDRAEEFAAFGRERSQRANAFRDTWPLVRSALSVTESQRDLFRHSTGGYLTGPPPAQPIPMLAIGSSGQTLQWIARHADGWATYYRPSRAQRDRFGLWRQALEQTGRVGNRPLLVQSMQLKLDPQPAAVTRQLPLGLHTGSHGLLDYLREAHELGVDHLMLNIDPGSRSLDEVLAELGQEVLPRL